jgi:hypothetical protein
VRKVLCFVTAAAAFLIWSVPANADVSFTQNQYGVNFTNDDGTWVVYTGCFGPAARGGGGDTVGPGYIARVIRSDGTKIVEDEGPLFDGNGTLVQGGGLGAFGFHLARGVFPFYFDPNNAWPVSGRFCKADLPFGVARTDVISGPYLIVDVGGSEADMSLDVYFQDWCNNDIARVRYRYQVSDSVVKVWVLVTELDDGCYANGGYAFIKEPKFFAKVQPTDYTRIDVFDSSNTMVCQWLGGDPTQRTGQCGVADRARFRWDFGTYAGDDGYCSSSNLCLTAIGRAYPGGDDIEPNHFTYPWEGSGLGLDSWAVASAWRTPANYYDGPENGYNDCNKPTDDQSVRRWEMAGSSWLGFSGDFHGWEGGVGAYDCEPLSVRFGPYGESFGMHFEYSINTGWSLQ